MRALMIARTQRMCENSIFVQLAGHLRPKSAHHAPIVRLDRDFGDERTTATAPGGWSLSDFVTGARVHR